MASTAPLVAVLEVVPQVEHAFGYGSGVFAQPQVPASDEVSAVDVRRASGDAASVPPRGSSTTMVDYVFAVRSPLEWHSENMRRNPSHYAPHLRVLGPSAVVAIADRVGVGVHFNTLVPWRGDADSDATLGPGHATHYKYGVVRAETLCEDLTDWRSLFVAGRMQKPVSSLVAPRDGLADAAAAKLRAALAAALLTLPETFTAHALRVALCGLSYRGDARRWFGAEDAHKVARIASGSANAVDALYAPAVASATGGAVGLTRLSTSTGVPGWGQDKTESSRRFLCRWLPRSTLAAIGGESAAAARDDLGARVLEHVDRTVRRSSLKQLCATALATSPGKAARYAAAKFAKSAASRFRKPPT
jgi:translocator assembly and maintenance protein 41